MRRYGALVLLLGFLLLHSLLRANPSGGAEVYLPVVVHKSRHIVAITYTSTPSRTPRATRTPTASPTTSASATASATASRTASATVAATASASATLSPTASTPASATPSATHPPTPSATTIPTASTTPTATRTPTPSATPTPTVDYQAILNAEAVWIASLQFDMPGEDADGAIVNFRNPASNSHIIPYFANFAAEGLLAKPEYAPRVKRYLDWYIRHLNRPDYNGLHGTIYDYHISPTGKEMVVMSGGHPHYDSTDSYAATFIHLVRRYYEVTGDAAYLEAQRSNIELIGGAIRATQQSDGLTWAKPDYQIKYLMDNAEVYVGFADLEWITQEVYQDPTAAATWRSYKLQVANGIESKLWSAAHQMYRPYIDGANNGPNPNWEIGYPDALAQMISLGTIVPPTSPRAQHLYTTFCLYYPNWPTPNGSSFPGAVQAYKATLLGDRARADTFLRTVQQRFIATGHPWPWYSAEAGYTMQTAHHLLTTPP